MIQFAIIGTSKISHTFLAAARDVTDFNLAAVYSRTKDKGEAFIKEYETTKVYTSLDELAADSSIEAVYIASPNKFHAAQTIQLLNAGKHVLCEKPIATSVVELQAMLKAAKENHVILLEAMRSVFDPGFEKIKELLPKLGKIRRATFSFSKISSRYQNYKEGIIENAFNPLLGNGAMMDLGVYCIHPMVALFGKPNLVTAQSVFLPNRMEGLGNITVLYDTMIGEISYSKVSTSYLPSEIEGEEGTLIIDSIPDTRDIKIIYRNGETQNLPINKHSNNMYYEIYKMIELIQKGETVQEYNRWSLWQMEILDQARSCVGIHEF